MNCFSCSLELQIIEPVPFADECPKCRSDVRVCKNCEFYDAKIYNECREPQAERTLEKERRNRCEFFQMKKSSSSAGKSAQQALMDAAEALFKKTT